MVMVCSDRKTAEVSVIWWLLIPPIPQPPPSNKLELSPPLLCIGASTEASCLPEIFTAWSWKDRPDRMVSASIVKGTVYMNKFILLMFEPSRLNLWEPAPNVPF